MRKSYLYAGLLPLSAACLFTGCVDDGYDVGDIDTTSRIEVKNLVLPLNLDQIKIDKVIELEDNENISIIDGSYAIEKTGEISTSTFKINPIHVNVAKINPSVLTIPTGSAAGVSMPGQTLPAVKVPSEMSGYDLSLKNIDKSLVSLAKVDAEGKISLSVTMSVNSATWNALSGLSFDGLKIQLPENLIGARCDVGSYDSASGVLTLNNGLAMSGGSLPVAITADGIENHKVIENHGLSISGEVGILEGATMTIKTNANPLPSDIVINVAYDIAGFDVKSFSGDVDYAMDDITINPISLSGLPEFLDSPATKIYLADPTIKININNPIGGYEVAGSGTLELSSNFSGTNVPSVASGELAIEKGKDVVSHIEFDTKKGFPTYMAGLDSILVSDKGGRGLPKTIDVKVKGLRFVGAAKDFPVGTNIEGAKGDYSFTAPFGFESGSQIIYEKTEAGWYDDDLAGLNIRTITLEAVCSTDLPVGLNLQVYPIDRQGNIIPVNEESNYFTVTAKSQAEPVMISVEAEGDGTISGLDGIRFIATVSQNDKVHGSTEPLGPDQTITLKDLRIKVDGYYEKEL